MANEEALTVQAAGEAAPAEEKPQKRFFIKRKPKEEKRESLGFLILLCIGFFMDILAAILETSYISIMGLDVGLTVIWPFITVLAEGTMIWLITHRASIMPTFGIIFLALDACVYITSGAGLDYLSSAPHAMANIMLDMIGIGYFALSRKVHRVMVKPFNLGRDPVEYAFDKDFYRPWTITFWRDLFIYFVLFSIVGNWMENSFIMLIRLGLVAGSSDPSTALFANPLNPYVIYGAGFVLAVLVVYPVRLYLQDRFYSDIPAIVGTFIFGLVIVTAIEYFIGIAINVPDANGVYPYWDYTDMFMNIDGQVCLQNSALFGVVITIVVWFIYPTLCRLFDRVSKDIMWCLFFVAIVAFIVLFFTYYSPIFVGNAAIR